MVALCGGAWRLMQWPRENIELRRELLAARTHYRALSLSKETLLRDLERIRQDYELARAGETEWRKRYADQLELTRLPASGLASAEVDRLAALIEECSRVAQRAATVLRFGWDGESPFNGRPNRGELERQMGHMCAAMDTAASAGDVRWTHIHAWRQKCSMPHRRNEKALADKV